MKELKEFLQQVMNDVVEDSEGEDIRFDLARWSRQDPYWCVFVCEHRNDNREFTNVGIYGHCQIKKKARFHRVIELLQEYGLKIEIHAGYLSDSCERTEGEKNL